VSYESKSRPRCVALYLRCFTSARDTKYI